MKKGRRENYESDFGKRQSARKGEHVYGAERSGKSLLAGGVETEIFWLGKQPLSGCLGCGGCLKTGKCFLNDKVNEFLEKAALADGFVFGTPVHFASASGAITAFMDQGVLRQGKTVCL